jgi:hypothetical protein
MAYSEKELNNIFDCNNCKQIFDEPRILPCGFSICSSCVANIHFYADNTFNCSLCSKKHVLPEEGFPVNRSLISLKSIDPVLIKQIELFQQSLDRIKETIIQLSFTINNSDEQIQEHCMNIKNDIQLTKEEAIEHISDLSEQLIQDVNEYERKCIRLNRMNSFDYKHYLNVLNELEMFHSKWSQYLMRSSVLIKNEIILEANKNAIDLNKKAEKEKSNLWDMIFNGDMVYFESNLCKISKLSLGFITFEHNIKNNAILNDTQWYDLMLLCEFKLDQKWQLLYRATRDGFNAFDFHSKCDQKTNTLIIFKSTNNNVFGGYTEASWSDKGFKRDPNSFLFSLINNDRNPLKMKCLNSNHAIFANREKGPIFGKGYDLFISNDSNQPIKIESNVKGPCYSYLGCTYKHTKYLYESNKACSFFAGSNSFLLSEIEVYTKKE